MDDRGTRVRRADEGDGSADVRPLVAVVGAGIAGLAAAWRLVAGPDAPRVVVLEASGRVGGKLQVGDLDGLRVDLGAESMLARRPEGVELVRAAGLGDDLVSPRPAGARIWSRGGLRALPTGTLMGVPSGPHGLEALLLPDEVSTLLAEPAGVWQPVVDDVDVATFVSARVGPAVVDRLVEPLLGGVYAGRSDRLSLQATVPALWQAATAGRSVVEAAAAAARAGTATQAPVFAGVRGGVGRLPEALALTLDERGVEIRTGCTVRALHRTADGWRLVTGPTTDERALDVSAVVLATPAAPTSRLLRAHSATAADALAGVEYASVALVTAVLPRSVAGSLPGSGFLVPPVEGRLVKAATFSSSKWEWSDDADAERVVLRTSVGRHGDEADLQREDADLVRVAVDDLSELLGTPLPVLASTVSRWGGALPQYAVGHVGRVAAVRRALDALPGLAVAGAAYDGVGIPACIASGDAAARLVGRHLAAPT
jgi:oxygen-dependent protoporphyrinogen oxidase